jgi:4-diphosphocytidyl-2-C-methyl-D-erythritol kinase
MIEEFARAKINLSLHVLGRRGDGYHVLDSTVAFADAGDQLTFSLSEQDRLENTGPFGVSLAADETNIVSKTIAALRRHVGSQSAPPVAITLEKNLPVASGIGGGSADAAATLRGLMRLWGIELDSAELNRLALSLGADVPVCLMQTYCRMRGVGEEIELLGKAPWPAIVLVNPKQSQMTASVFRELGLDFGERHGTALNLADTSSWRNDLQDPARRLLPVIDDVIDTLNRHASQSVVRMSGSGATCFALCDTSVEAERVASAILQERPLWWVSFGHLN